MPRKYTISDIAKEYNKFLKIIIQSIHHNEKTKKYLNSGADWLKINTKKGAIVSYLKHI